MGTLGCRTITMRHRVSHSGSGHWMKIPRLQHLWPLLRQPASSTTVNHSRAARMASRHSLITVNHSTRHTVHLHSIREPRRTTPPRLAIPGCRRLRTTPRRATLPLPPVSQAILALLHRVDQGQGSQCTAFQDSTTERQGSSITRDSRNNSSTTTTRVLLRRLATTGMRRHHRVTRAIRC